jgi:hypothetical protein
MAPTPKPYAIISTPVHENRWNEQLQTVESGWKVTAQWLATGTIIPVFVPDAADLVTTADLLIRQQGAQIDALHS